MSRDQVDIGVIAWNTRDLTVSAVQRALEVADADGVDARVLLRDNGSSDGTAEALRGLDRVDVERGDNVGFAAGVNSIVRRSHAPWLLLLNSDAWPERGAWSALLSAARSAPRAAVVAPRLLRPDGSPEPSLHPLPSLRTALAGAVGHPPSLGNGWAVGACLLLRREAVLDIGPWDESYFMYGEDLDFCWRARLRGWDVVAAPDAVVRHVGNASGRQRFGDSREQVAVRNARRVVAARLGPGRARLWSALNAVGAGRMALLAELSRDRDRARYWWRQLPAHVGRL